MYDVPEQMQDQWRERVEQRRRSAARLMVFACIFFIICIILGSM